MNYHELRFRYFQVFINNGFKIFISIACLLLFVRFSVISYEQVAGNSMVPHLKSGEKFFLNKAALYFRKPKRGEVVQTISPDKKSLVVKRVIGLPKETIYFKDGLVYIGPPGTTSIEQAHKLEEPYLDSNIPTLIRNQSDLISFTIPENRYFLLGDNRAFSTDSRVYGPVDRLYITGVAMEQDGVSQQYRPHLGHRYQHKLFD